MACPHPDEERVGVYEGGHARLAGRHLCTLCGEIVYSGSGSRPPTAVEEGRGSTRPVGMPSHPPDR